MALASMTLACCLFYAGSKYFPWSAHSFFQDHKTKFIWFASAIALCSFYLFTLQYNAVTALMIWSVALMCLLSAIVLSLTMNKRWIWVWGIVFLLFIAIDFL